MTSHSSRVEHIEVEWENTDILAGESLSQEYIEELIEIAGSDDEEAASSAVNLIRDISDVQSSNLDGYVGTLSRRVEQLDEDKEWKKVDELIKSIGAVARNEPKAAVESYELLFEYHTHESPYRSSAANALPYFADIKDNLIDSLVERLKNNTASQRKESAFVIKKIAEEHPDKLASSITLLLEFAEDPDENSGVQQHSLEALARYAEEYPDETSPYIQNILDISQDSERYHKVRGSAAEVLAAFAEYHPEAFIADLEELAVLLEDENSIGVRRYTAKVLQEIAKYEPKSLENMDSEIQSACLDDFGPVRDASLNTLSILVDEGVVISDEVYIDQEDLVSLVESNSAGTMGATLPSIKLLGHVADSEAISSLESIIEAETGHTPEEKEAAKQAITQIQNR